MSIEPLNGPFSPYGADSPRELERKINGNFRQLYAASPGANPGYTPVNLTVDQAGNPLDSPRTLQSKVNAMLAELAALRGQPYSPVRADRDYPLHGGLRQSQLESLFLQQYSADRAVLSPPPGVYPLPVASVGSDAGKGFNCTGLVRDPLDGTWWLGNDGRARGASLAVASVVHVSADFSTLLDEHTTAELGFPNGYSVQGVTMLGDNVAFVRKLPGASSAGQIDYLTVVSRAGVLISNTAFSTHSTDFNGLTNDTLRDLWVASSASGISWRNRGTLDAATPVRTMAATVDHIHYRADDDSLYTTGGSNGVDGTLTKYNASTLASVGSAVLPGSKAVEGCAVFDGKVAAANNLWFHNGTDANCVIVYSLPQGL